MANYQDFPTSMWETLLEYSPDSQLLFIYFWTNHRSRPSGLYKINLKSVSYALFAHEGPPGSRLEAAYRPLLGRLIEFDEKTQEVWVIEKAKHIRKLSDNAPMQKSVQTDIKLLESEVLREAFLRVYKELSRPPIGCLSQGQGHSQGQEKREEREKREKQFVETPTRTNSNQERWEYPPEVKAMIQGVLKKRSVTQEKKS